MNQAPAGPSLPKVIGTTLQLWLRRRVLRVGDQPGAGRLARQRAMIAGLVILAIAGSATAAVAVSRDSDPASDQGTTQPGVNSPAIRAATANRELAARWITSQVGHAVIVACDPLMCSELQRDGFPPGDLEQLGASASDPLGSGIVVSTTALRSLLGPRLAGVYAPVVLASFGSGQSVVQVRVIAPDGAAAYELAEHADLLARRSDGRQLAHNKNIHLSVAARAQLLAGSVDSRLLITLAALAASYPVYVAEFGDPSPGAAADIPFRSMTISTAVRLRRATRTSYLRLVLAFLHAQQAPLRASAEALGAGTAGLLQIEFTAPSPPGLLNAQAQN